MSRRTVEANKAIRVAWQNEQELVREGKGTRDWTKEQQQDILDRGKAYDGSGRAFDGQHMKSAEKYPEYQGDPGNIQFLTREEHLEAHQGNWQNPTNWYYDPVTKQFFDFGEGLYIPCKIIELSEPIVHTADITEDAQATAKSNRPPNEESPLCADAARDSLSSSYKKMDFENSVHKLSTMPKSKKANQFTHFVAGARGVAKRLWAEHREEIIGVGLMLMAAVPKIIDAVTSSNGFSASESGSGNESVHTPYTNVDTDHNDTSESSERPYTPNDVPAGSQRYHYKDGSVKWVEKAPYHRDGNKKE